MHTTTYSTIVVSLDTQLRIRILQSIRISRTIRNIDEDQDMEEEQDLEEDQEIVEAQNIVEDQAIEEVVDITKLNLFDMMYIALVKYKRMRRLSFERLEIEASWKNFLVGTHPSAGGNSVVLNIRGISNKLRLQ